MPSSEEAPTGSLIQAPVGAVGNYPSDKQTKRLETNETEETSVKTRTFVAEGRTDKRTNTKELCSATTLSACRSCILSALRRFLVSLGMTMGISEAVTQR